MNDHTPGCEYMPYCLDCSWKGGRGSATNARSQAWDHREAKGWRAVADGTIESHHTEILETTHDTRSSQ